MPQAPVWVVVGTSWENVSALLSDVGIYHLLCHHRPPDEGRAVHFQAVRVSASCLGPCHLLNKYPLHPLCQHFGETNRCGPSPEDPSTWQGETEALNLAVTGAAQRCPALAASGWWPACIAPPPEVKWPCVLLRPSRTSPEGGLWGKEEGVAGEGGSKGVGCAAGADPLRKGSESRSGQVAS